MDRSAIALLMTIAIAMWGGVPFAIDGLRIVLAAFSRNEIPTAHFVYGLMLIGAAYVALRGLIRWVTANWKFSRREDLVRRGLPLGSRSAFDLSVIRRSKVHLFEYAELNVIVVLGFLIPWYLRSTGVCSGDGTFGNSCLRAVGLLFGVPYMSILVSYILRWGSQPRPT
jgi:uncharacterized membrane protein YidH (DUF202 family)